MFNQSNLPPSIVVDTVYNTLTENGEPIKSEQFSAFCKRAAVIEQKVYILDGFDLADFMRAFDASNKLNSHPKDKRLPYEPEDIKLFNNGAFIFRDLQKKIDPNIKNDTQDVAYFTALCFFKKNGNNIESIHIRFLAGIDENYRGMGFQYAPLFNHVFSVLEEFSKKYPGQNPIVNITQFGMVSPGTPGAIINFTNILSSFLGVPKFEYGCKEASKMGCMYGLGNFINPNNGIANFNMKIRFSTFEQNKDNKGASAYNSLNLKEGEGITGRQELGKLKDLLKVKPDVKNALETFAEAKSVNAQTKIRKDKM